jgi:hypothetical protein
LVGAIAGDTDREDARRRLTLWVGIVTLVGLGGLAAADGDKSDPLAGWTADLSAEKADLVSTGRNPYFILEPGYTLVLEGGAEQLTITVRAETKMVDGVQTRVVEERGTKNGELEEVARNYVAISKRTNSVFYFGEDVDNYKKGKVVNHDGSYLFSASSSS